MNSDHHRLVRELFHELCELSPKERTRALRRRGKDLPKDVVEDVRSLLDEDQEEEEDLFGKTALGTLGGLVREVLHEPPISKDALPEKIGEFEIVGKVGQGGMGVVYEGRHVETGTRSAVKVLRWGSSSKLLIKRFRREMQILDRLEHVGIPKFFDAGSARLETQHGGTETLPFLAMEYVAGLPLNRHTDEKNLDEKARIELISRVGDAVQHAHENGIVHRDLKPANILVVDDEDDPIGQPKVLDFGVSRATGEGLDTLTETASGMVLGTLPYMSPEQLTGRVKEIGPTSDVYSLGVLLYETLMGRLPYNLRGKPLPEAIQTIEKSEPNRIESSILNRVGPKIDTILRKALDKNPARRYQSAATLSADLRSLLSGEAIGARLPALPIRVVRFFRRHPLQATLLVGVHVLLAAALLIAYREASLRRISDRNLEAALDSTYRAQIAAASSAIGVDKIQLARARLERAPESRRGWEWSHLHSRLDESVHRMDLREIPPNQFDFKEHGVNKGSSIAFDADGSKIILGLNRGPEFTTILTMDLKSQGTSPKVVSKSKAISFSPDGKFFCFEKDGELHVESTSDGSTLRRFPFREFGWLGLSCKPSRFVLEERHSGPLLLSRDKSPGSLTPLLAPPSATVSKPAIDPTGRRLVRFHEDGIWLWDLENGGPPRRLVEASFDSHSANGILSLSPGGHRIAVTGEHGSVVNTWEIDSQGTSATPSRAWLGHRDEVVSIAWNRDGTRAATSSEDRTTRLWSFGQNSPDETFIGALDATALAFSPDETRLATLDTSGTVHLWDVSQSDPRVLPISDYVYGLALGAEGKRLYVGGNDGVVRVYDTATSLPIVQFSPSDREIRHVEIHPHGTQLAVSYVNQRVLILNPSTGEEITSIECSVAWCDFSPDGTRFALYTTEGRLEVFDTTTWESVATATTISTPSATVSFPEVRYSSDGQLIAAAFEKRVGIYSADTLAPIAELDCDATIFRLRFSPDGRTLTASEFGSNVDLWDVESWTRTRVIYAHEAAVYGLALFPDGSRIVSGSNDRTLKIFDLHHPEPLLTIFDHDDYIYSIDVDPQGQRIYTASGDGNVRIFETSPIATRVQARDEYRATEARLGPEIDTLLEDVGPEEAQRRIRNRKDLSDREREIALQVLVGRTVGRK